LETRLRDDWRRKLMATTEKTLDRLHHLEALYRHGYRSEVIDRSLGKILALERTTATRQFGELEGRLRELEVEYQMSSNDFYRRFRAGELGDAIDFVEWSAFYEMRETVRKGLEVLGAEVA